MADVDELKRRGAWFSMSLPKYSRGLIVAFTQAAWDACFHRFGAWEIVLMWDQVEAWARGVEEIEDPAEKEARMLEALLFFEEKQFGTRNTLQVT